MIMELKTGVLDEMPLVGNEGEAMTSGDGKDGESTIMPGICAERFAGAFREGIATWDVLTGTEIGIPAIEETLGDDRSIVLTGVARSESGDEGERSVEGSVRDILNCDTFDGFVLEAAEDPELSGVRDIAWVDDSPSPVGVVCSGGDMYRDTWVMSAVELGPMLTTSPFLSISNISLAAGSISSSLSPSSPPTRFPSSSLPNRTADLRVEDCDAGTMLAPRDWDGRVDDAGAREDLKRDAEGLGGEDAREASRGTT